VKKIKISFETFVKMLVVSNFGKTMAFGMLYLELFQNWKNLIFFKKFDEIR
jgi:hypothetical protein